jgi:hypothetical protein
MINRNRETIIDRNIEFLTDINTKTLTNTAVEKTKKKKNRY